MMFFLYYGSISCIIQIYIIVGGRYDENDDCCTRRCTPERPCDHGEGHCESNSDCKHPWLTCGNDYCNNANYFPVAEFPVNHLAGFYLDTDNCCYKPCNPSTQCDTNVFGCESDKDCKDGLYCNKEDNHCRDVNECDVNNGRDDGLYKCGRYTSCTNHNKYFSCACKTGFKDFTDYDGCVDKNECTEGGHNCKLEREYCFNTIGSFVCICKEGYTGAAPGSCKDVDECANGFHNCSSFQVVNAETSEIDGAEKSFNVGPYTINDDNEHLFKFDLQAFDSSLFGLGDETGKIALKVKVNEVRGFFINAVGEISTPANNKLDHPENAYLGNDSVTYHCKIKIEGDGMTVKFGANGEDYPGSILFMDFPLTITKFSFKTIETFSFWRNVRKVVRLSENCINTIGSYKCFSSSLENIAIGIGGEGKSWETHVSIMKKDLFSCSHSIPEYPTIISRHASAVLENWLYSCGGYYYYYGNIYTSTCYRFDLQSAGNSGWETSPSLPFSTYGHTMVTFKTSIYLMGGYHPSKSKNTNYEFNLATNAWTRKANIPYYIHYAGCVPDEENDRIWLFGGGEYGVGTRNYVYYYTVSSNSWHHHSSLPIANEDLSCQKILNKNDENMLICMFGNRGEGAYYYNLDQNSGWHHLSRLYNSYTQRTMRMIKFDPYNLALLSGYSNWFKQSLQNIFVYDIDSQSFKYKYNYLQIQGDGAWWATAPRNKDFRALSNCAAARTYAAVGWGGHTKHGHEYPKYWSVILHKKTLGNPGVFHPCHQRAIPDLEPGRYVPGITSVGYKLMVCGGHEYSKSIESSCFYLDTNTPQESPSWIPMDNMLHPRAGFVFVSYGDIAYAMGGRNEGSKYGMRYVDRWTESKGWEVSTPLPKSLKDACGVADEGHNRIYHLAGSYTSNSKNVYYYDVIKDTWSSLPSLPRSYTNAGCAIVKKKNNGNRQLIISGSYQSSSARFNLDKYENGERISWGSMSTSQKSRGSRLVSLSLSEVLQVKFSLIYQKALIQQI